MPSAASVYMSRAATGAGNRSSALTRTRRPAAASAKVEAMATTRRDAESDASSGTTTSQMAANEAMPPVDTATTVTRPVNASADNS